MPMHLTNPIGVLDHFEPCSARAILLIVKPSPRVYKCLYNKELLYVHMYIIYIFLSPSSHLFILPLHISARHKTGVILIQTNGLKQRLKSQL